jgi:hypothetical protein
VSRVHGRRCSLCAELRRLYITGHAPLNPCHPFNDAQKAIRTRSAVAMRVSDIGPSLRSLLGTKDYTYSPLQPRDLQGQSRGGRRRNRFALVLGTFAILAMLLIAIIRRFGRTREHASPMLHAQVAHIIFTDRVAVREGAKQQPAVNRRPLTYGASTRPSSACHRTSTLLSRPLAS